MFDDAADLKAAARVREVLCDKTGDDGWMAIDASQFVMFLTDDNDIEQSADFALEQGYEPHHMSRED